MPEYGYEVREAARVAIQCALRDRPISNEVYNAVDSAMRHVDLSEAFKAGIIQAVQMGLLTTENDPAKDIEIVSLKGRLEKLEEALRLAMKGEHHWSCRGGKTKGTFYHGPCSDRCKRINKVLPK